MGESSQCLYKLKMSFLVRSKILRPVTKQTTEDCKMLNSLGMDRESILEDYEPIEINGLDDLIFEYERDRDLESELQPYLDLNDH